jgi:hypothetical protein
MSRVGAVVAQIGSPQPLLDVSATSEASPSTGASTRRSALKARRAINPRSTWATDATAWLSQTTKALRALERRRKARHVALRDAPFDDAPARRCQTCPVCLSALPGEQDAVDAHIDSCLAHAAMAAEDAAARGELGAPDNESEDGWQEVEIDGTVRLRPGGRALQAAGIQVRAGDEDIDDEIDIDGDDADAYGAAQFTEFDIVGLHDEGQTIEVIMNVEADIDGDDTGALPVLPVPDLPHRSREVEQIAHSSTSSDEADISELTRADAAVITARRSGNHSSLIQALEGKIQLLVSHPLFRHLHGPDVRSRCRLELPPLRRPSAAFVLTRTRNQQ